MLDIDIKTCYCLLMPENNMTEKSRCFRCKRTLPLKEIDPETGVCNDCGDALEQEFIEKNAFDENGNCTHCDGKGFPDAECWLCGLPPTHKNSNSGGFIWNRNDDS